MNVTDFKSGDIVSFLPIWQFVCFFLSFLIGIFPTYFTKLSRNSYSSISPFSWLIFFCAYLTCFSKVLASSFFLQASKNIRYMRGILQIESNIFKSYLHFIAYTSARFAISSLNLISIFIACLVFFAFFSFSQSVFSVS